ncbi:MAG: hypothetical protein Q8O87_02895 [bacterium]|nr:hypothetical protein [bacterium]
MDVAAMDVVGIVLIAFLAMAALIGSGVTVSKKQGQGPGILIGILGAMVILALLYRAYFHGYGTLKDNCWLAVNRPYVVQEIFELADGSYMARISDDDGNEYLYGLDELPPRSFIVVYINGKRHYIFFEWSPPEASGPDVMPDSESEFGGGDGERENEGEHRPDYRPSSKQFQPR